MGSVLSLFSRNADQFFNYDIQQTEASEALDAAIANHLREIGAGTAIPFRIETPAEINVPIGLLTPAFTFLNENEMEISFASTLPGKMTVFTIDQSEKLQEFDFRPSKNQKIAFMHPKFEKFSISFNFDPSFHISARIYTFYLHGNSAPTIIEDRLVIDGKVNTISKIYGQEGVIVNQDSEDNMCLICYCENANVIALPCRHCCMCRQCAERFANFSKNCPICRTHVDELVQLANKKK